MEIKPQTMNNEYKDPIKNEIIEALEMIGTISELTEITPKDCDNVDPNSQKFESIKRNSEQVYVFRFMYKVGKEKVVGFISVPRNMDLSKMNKTIVALRGGNRETGSIKNSYFFDDQSYFSWFSVSGEYVTLTTQYRGNNGGTGVDQYGGDDLDDSKELFNIISKLPFCDKSLIGAYGWSRGSQTLLQLLKTENWIKTAVCASGPTDHMRTIKENFRENWFEHMQEMFGGNPEGIIDRSALYWADKIRKIPILIMHGKNDERVDLKDSIDLHEKLPQSQLVILDPGSHSLKENIKLAKEKSLQWFADTLK